MKVYLRDMVESDLPTVLSWRNMEGVRKNMYTSHLISRDEHKKWWDRESANPKTRLLIAMNDKEPVGVVNFTHYTGQNGTAMWAFYAGENVPRGTGSKMEAAALQYAFEKLKLRKLECEVLSFNMPVVYLHLKFGFEVEGIFRQAYERNGEYFDIYRLALMQDIWRLYIAPMLDKVENVGRYGLVGQSVKKRVALTMEKINAFVIASGDRNPVHLDDEYAKRQGFSGRITHGMLAGSLFSEIFANEFPGSGTIYLMQTLNFLKTIPVGGEVDVEVKVISHVGRKLLVDTSLYVQGNLCISGQAKLLMPKDSVK